MSRTYIAATTLYISLIFGLSIPLLGQGYLINQVRTLQTRNISNLRYDDIDGSPYYSKDFINSTIYLKNGNYSNQPLRYDMFQEEMEFNKDGEKMWLIRKDIKYITYGSEMVFVSSADADTNKLGYYFLKDEGRYLLFYKKSVLFEPAVTSKGYSDPIPDRFKPDNDIIYIRYQGNPAVRIRTKKDLLEYFSENQSALDFIQKEKIKADKIDDMHKLISFLNEMKD